MKQITISFWVGLVAIVVIWYVGRLIYFQPKLSIGEAAPDFEGIVISGDKLRLQDLRGNYVLIHFWGSWCGPCRQENPAWQEVYSRYQASGFQIIGIGIEKKMKNWQLAIQRDGLQYPYHILATTSNFKFLDAPLAKLYGIKQIPSNFLLNKQGIIVATNFTPTRLAAYLQEKLQKQEN